VNYLNPRPFVYNNAFRVLRNPQFFVGGELRFPVVDPPYREDPSYRTLFGPTIAHNGVVYAVNDHNESYALRRLTASREPTVPGAEQILQNNNATFFTATFAPHLRRLARAYAPSFAHYTDALQEAKEHVHDPHPKQRARIAALAVATADGTVAKRLWTRTVKYRMKAKEIAKVGKYPRMIADLSVTASLQGFVLTALLKKAQASHPYHVNGGVIQFVDAPHPRALRRALKQLENPAGRFHYLYFSDDACLAIRTSRGIERYNIDISSCDSSHGTMVFDSLINLMPPHAQDDMRKLVEQCQMPITLRSYSEPSNKLILEPLTPRLYSGSTITTGINNLANLAIAIAVTNVPDPTPLQIIAAARQAGYIITLDTCTMLEDIQFLKHSPSKCSCCDKYQMLLNPGVMLRLSGVCMYDLPGRGPIRPRAEAFQHALLRGLYANARFPFLETMRSTVPTTTKAAVDCVTRQLSERNIFHTNHTFTDSHVFQRYRFTQRDFDLLYEFGRSEFGYTTGNPAIHSIINKDYGLETNHYIGSPYPISQTFPRPSLTTTAP
jgi:hypothetical protein